MTVANFAEPPPPPPEPVPCWPTAGDFKKAFEPLVLTCVPISLDPIHGAVLTSEWHVVRKYGETKNTADISCVPGSSIKRGGWIVTKVFTHNPLLNSALVSAYRAAGRTPEPRAGLT